MLLSVERAATLRGAAQTRYLLVFERELVIVRDLFVYTNLALRVNHNLLLTFKRHDLRIAVGLKETHDVIINRF